MKLLLYTLHLEVSQQMLSCSQRGERNTGVVLRGRADTAAASNPLTDHKNKCQQGCADARSLAGGNEG